MTSQSPTEQSQSLETLQDIKRMMERSSRFISLSGLSGVSAGLCALIGAYIAHTWILDYYGANGYVERHGYMRDGANNIQWKLFGVAIGILGTALITSTWFTWRKARKSKLPIWDHASKKLAINMAIPLATGGA